MYINIVIGAAALLSKVSAVPVVIEASGQWQGDDGPWSTFNVKIGSPSQTVSVLPVPYRNALVVIGPEACPADPQLGNCSQDRGNTFKRSDSQSWRRVDSLRWDPTESIIGPSTRRNASTGNNMIQPLMDHPMSPFSTHKYGIDSIQGTATKDGAKSWKIPDQGVMSLGSMYPYTGMMGLGTNFNGTAKYPVSFFDNVRGVSEIKSVSWSYTAGSKSKNAPGSLVFGGYDASRFDQSTSVKCAMHRDATPLKIQVGNITINDPSQPGPQTIELPSPFIADIDFTKPYLTLPEQITSNLERMLGITWDNMNSLYRVNDARHDDLIRRNATVTIPIVGDGGKKQNIIFPYASLILEGKFPMVNSTTKYFAVQKAAQMQTSFTLGRVFLQEAHVTAVFDDPSGSYVSVAQAKYDKGSQPQIVEIVTPGYRKNKKTNAGTVAGVLIVIIAALALIGYLVFAKLRRRFPFAAAPARRTNVEDEEGKSLSDLSTHSKKLVDDRAESRLSKSESVYYEAMDEIPDEGPSKSVNKSDWPLDKKG